MPIAIRRIPALIVIVSLVFAQLPSNIFAQAAQPTPQQLDQLLAPIALYPDSLLAQITTASTNPQEILDVDNWLANNPGLTGDQLDSAAQQQGFDPAFLALVHFPDVLQMMAENIDDYAAIGQAVSTDQAAVSASIQRLRAQAYAAGSLQSTPQQTVVVQQAPQPIYVIQPANPQVVYVPQYNPAVVYAPPAPSTGAVVATSLITFGVGMGIGALIASNQPWGWNSWGWNWAGRTINYNRNPWGGWHGGYRPPNPWYRPRPIEWHNKPGYGGNWHYRPPNYRPPVPVNRPRPVQPGRGNRPVFSQPRRPTNPPQQNRPGNSRPPTTIHPVQPPRPAPTRPSRPNSPPSRPSTPTQRPSTSNPPRQRPPNQNPPMTRPPAQGNPNRNQPGQSSRPPNPSRPQQQGPAPTNNRVRPSSQPAPQSRPPQGGAPPNNQGRPNTRPQGG